MCCQHRSVTPQRQEIVPKPVAIQSPMPVQRTISQNTALPVRQKVLAPTKCQVCGYPIQAVHMAGKTVTRCSNANCSG